MFNIQNKKLAIYGVEDYKNWTGRLNDTELHNNKTTVKMNKAQTRFNFVARVVKSRASFPSKHAIMVLKHLAKSDAIEIEVFMVHTDYKNENTELLRNKYCK